MSKKSLSQVARRAWRVLRLALLWARKGGLFRNKLVISLNLLSKALRKLRHTDHQRRALAYGDREFSFEDTPIIRVKMPRRPSSLRFKMPHIPCMRPHVDFDYDYDFEFDDEDDGKASSGFDREHGISFLKDDGAEEEEDEEEMNVAVCDEGIDLKAEEFIAKFYEQMKMQRQISYIEYGN